MLKPLVTLCRYGDVVKIVRFEKTLLVGYKRHNFVRRIKSKNTLKQTQNIWRAKNKINEYITVCNHVLKNPAFATFTYTKPQNDINQAIQDWRDFTRRIKKHFPDVAFLRVPERHKSGAVHFHAVMFGLPSNLPCTMIKRGRYWIHSCPKTKPCERQLRALAGIWAKGFVDLSEARKPEALGVYLSKYLTKGEPDWTLFGSQVYSPNFKMYQVLRQAKTDGLYYKISSHSNPYGVDFVEEDLKDVLLPVKFGQFSTKWLGEARCEVYKVNPPL